MNNEETKKNTYKHIVAFFKELKEICSHVHEFETKNDIMYLSNKIDKKFNWFEDYFVFYVKNKYYGDLDIWNFYDKCFTLTFDDFKKFEDIGPWEVHLRTMLEQILPFLKGSLKVNNCTVNTAKLIVKHLHLRLV